MKRKLFNLKSFSLPAILGLSLLSLSQIAQARQGSHPTHVGIVDFDYAGSGCNQDSLRGIYDSEDGVFLLFFKDFDVRKASNKLVSRKSCTMGIELNAPEGWQYTVKEIAYGGYCHLNSGAMAILSSSIDVGLSDGRQEFEDTAHGPQSGGLGYYKRVSRHTDAWSACGGDRPIHINVNTVVRGRGSYGRVTMDTPLILTLQWRRC